MELGQLAKFIEQEADKLTFADEFKKYPMFRTHSKILSCPSIGRYYFLLAAAAKVLESKNAMDLGTCAGVSAMALAKYAKHVDTYDITWRRLAPGLFFDENFWRKDNMQFILTTERGSCVLPFHEYDLIFVDVDPHDGIQEAKIHKRIEETYKGHVFWDDVNQPAMAAFWETISQPKVTLSRGSIEGLIGLVRY